MRFSIKQLLIAVFLIGLCIAGPVSWYRWYNHEIATFDVGAQHRVCFRSKYEAWRGPRRVLDVKIYENDRELLDLTCRVPSYHLTTPKPKMYYSKDRKYVCITYPGAKNYILGDIQRKDFATRFLGKGCLLYTSPSPRDGLLSRMPSSA